MTTTEALTIEKVSNSDNSIHYDCIGSIDAHAAPVLEELNSVPANTSVLLDFSKIERVNSMGLSLLLKLFEEWENNSIDIEVKHLNRMVSMLFKITGLGRFINKGGSDAKTVTEPLKPKVVAPASVENSQDVRANTGAEHGKLNFVATLQTGQQLTGWYLMNTYLQRKMQRAIHFEQSQSLDTSTPRDLAFTNPFEACSMVKNKGYIPVMRPVGEADEVVILVRADENIEIEGQKNTKVVTANEQSFVYLLGRFLCDESGADSSTFDFEFAGNEIKALQMLIRKKADMLFMLKKTYEGLSSFARSNVTKLDESMTDFAYHLFCVAPYMKDQADQLATILTGMQSDEKGQQTLKDIQFEGWCKPEGGELQMLQMVYDKYVG